MSSKNQSYNQLLKATTIFGGVQVFNVIISIIRTKFVAVFLGASGLGVFSIFQNTANLIYTISHLGISSSAIREISIANASEDKVKISRTIGVFMKWVILTGLVGTVFMLIAAPYLSEITFGNKDYQNGYRYISVIILFSALSNSQMAVLKAMRKVRDLAKANVIGSFIGLVISIPLFYFLRSEGIVLSIIIAAALAVICTTYFSRKIETVKVSIDLLQSYREGRGMILLGFIMTISSLLTVLNNFMINAHINEKAGLEVLGLYQSGISISTKYVGMIFTAMAMDFYPRLSMINEDNVEVRNSVNQQMEIGLLIISPILILMISTMPVLINLLYSEEFLPIVEFVQWLSLGIFIKAISWPIGYIILAKGHSKTFLISEITALSILFSANIFGFNYNGLNGLGISILFSNVIHLIFLIVLTRLRYDFKIEKPILKLIVIKFIICLVALTLAFSLGFPRAYWSGLFFFILSSFISLKILNTKTGLIQKLKRKRRKNDGK
jgi:O-antigen/teichoic acid export membrane protein